MDTTADRLTLPVTDEPRPAAAPTESGGAAQSLAADLTREMDAPTVNSPPPIAPPPDPNANKRGRGRPKKTEIKPPRASIIKPANAAPQGPSTAPAVVDAVAEESPEELEARLNATATMICKGLLTIGSCLGGRDEWAFQPGEEEELHRAAVVMCRANNFAPASPTTVFLAAAAAYSLPRLQGPRTSERVQNLIAPIQLNVGRLLGRIFG